MDKIEDFGVHANAYYQLKVEIYKTRMDEQLLGQLWEKYWVATLSQSLASVSHAWPCTQRCQTGTSMVETRMSMARGEAFTRGGVSDASIRRVCSADAESEQGIRNSPDDRSPLQAVGCYRLARPS